MGSRAPLSGGRPHDAGRVRVLSDDLVFCLWRGAVAATSWPNRIGVGTTLLPQLQGHAEVQPSGGSARPRKSQTALSRWGLKTGLWLGDLYALVALVEVMPAHTNHSAAFPGPVIRLGGRRRTALTCRDEVLAAIDELEAREGLETFTVRQIAAEMMAAGSAYKRSAIAKTIQRMRGEDGCAATPNLERVDRTHFRLRADSSR
jgi:hypothetical protein